MRGKSVGWLVAMAAVVGLLSMIVFRFAEAQPGAAPAQPAAPAAAAAAGGPKYTVVETDITNLLVVDNSTNTVYFYTVEQGKEAGEDLHLRGSLDLNEVGKAVLKPKKAEKK
jgi:hypothetical protein